MKKKIVLLLILIGITSIKAQDWANRGKYASSNKELSVQKNDQSIVFIGNSITEGWVNIHPNFFIKNKYIGRGISGQTSPQLLLRFRQDVIDLHPQAVVINIGINDIAENTGPYNEDFTFGNIVSMVELAQANQIKVLLSSVLPAGKIPWRKNIGDAPSKITALNKRIKEYANKQQCGYIDYYSAMKDPKDNNNSMISSYTDDGVHPTTKGYDLMESISSNAIEQYLHSKQ